MRLIDADRFLSQIEDQYMEHDITREKYMDLEDRIAQQPTIEQPHWIPCKERLPEVGEYVLTCISGFEDGCMGIDFLEKHIGGLHWMNDHGDLTDLEAITAWMPMPKPYKEEEE